METAAYSAKQIDVLLSTSGVLLPVVTGYLVLISGSLGKLYERGAARYIPTKRLLVAVFGMAIISIGFWGGTLAFLVDTAYAYGRSDNAPPIVNLAQLNIEWTFGIACAQLALFCFLLSVSSYGYLLYRVYAS